MDADEPDFVETEIEVLDGEIVHVPRRSAIERVRGAVADPRVQAAASAATGFVAGAATLALMKRVGLARAADRFQPGPVGPSSVGWPVGPTIGPIQPGTYIVRVRALGGPPPLGPQQQRQ